MEKNKVGVVFGGRSSEYPVSLHSVASFLNALDLEKYEPVLIGIDRDGQFWLSDASIDQIEHDTWKSQSRPALFTHGGLQTQEGFIPLDVVFPVLHGKNGEDGTLQGLLELYQIPYVGCDVLSSAACMDKEITHRLMEQAGIPMAPYRVVHEDFPPFEEVAAQVELPWIVKPCNAGSSFGVSFVENPEQYERAVKEALLYDGKGKALIEKAIDGFEIGCAVLGDRNLRVGEIDEIETGGSFFDYEGKYELKDSAIYCPARISRELSDQAKQLAMDAYRSMGCSGLARVDMFVDRDGNLVLNEINTIPGLTQHSRYPTMMAQAGLPFDQLISTLIDTSLSRKVGAW